MCQLKLELLGVVSERAVILYSLIADRLSWTKFRDSSGQPFCYFTVDDVAKKFCIGQTQAKQAFRELEIAGLIVRIRSGQGKPSKIYIQTDGKPTAKTDGNPPPIDDNISCYNISSSSGEICENQQTFDDLFLMMTVKDVVSEILCQLVAKNPQEFAEINAEIINFVAENIRNAAENKKIANLTGYARAALRHGKTDYECEASRTETTGYGATYDIAAYESVSAADSPEWGGENYDTFEISTNTGEK